jgi:hypothetical protein
MERLQARPGEKLGQPTRLCGEIIPAQDQWRGQNESRIRGCALDFTPVGSY